MINMSERLGFHPATEATGPIHATIRKDYLALADKVQAMLPEGREASLAMTALQESMMWANAAVAMQAPLVES